VQGPPAREVQKLLVLGGTPLLNDVWLLDDVTQGLDGEWVTEWILVRHTCTCKDLLHCAVVHRVNRLHVCRDAVAERFFANTVVVDRTVHHCTHWHRLAHIRLDHVRICSCAHAYCVYTAACTVVKSRLHLAVLTLKLNRITVRALLLLLLRCTTMRSCTADW
jgi:hypothetical protein